MTKKRYKKLLMAMGYSRNEAAVIMAAEDILRAEIEAERKAIFAGKNAVEAALLGEHGPVGPMGRAGNLPIEKEVLMIPEVQDKHGNVFVPVNKTALMDLIGRFVALRDKAPAPPKNGRRLIDANALTAYFEEQYNLAMDDPDPVSGYVMAVLRCCTEYFKTVPTVDAVEVVRWESWTENEEGFVVCSVSGMKVHTEAFCSYGERRNDGC